MKHACHECIHIQSGPVRTARRIPHTGYWTPIMNFLIPGLRQRNGTSSQRLLVNLKQVGMILIRQTYKKKLNHDNNINKIEEHLNFCCNQTIK